MDILLNIEENWFSFNVEKNRRKCFRRLFSSVDESLLRRIEKSSEIVYEILAVSPIHFGRRSISIPFGSWFRSCISATASIFPSLPSQRTCTLAWTKLLKTEVVLRILDAFTVMVVCQQSWKLFLLHLCGFRDGSLALHLILLFIHFIVHCHLGSFEPSSSLQNTLQGRDSGSRNCCTASIFVMGLRWYLTRSRQPNSLMIIQQLQYYLISNTRILNATLNKMKACNNRVDICHFLLDIIGLPVQETLFPCQHVAFLGLRLSSSVQTQPFRLHPPFLRS